VVVVVINHSGKGDFAKAASCLVVTGYVKYKAHKIHVHFASKIHADQASFVLMRDDYSSRFCTTQKRVFAEFAFCLEKKTFPSFITKPANVKRLCLQVI